LNRGEARTRVRFYLNEPSAAQWTDAQLNELILESNVEWHERITFNAPWQVGAAKQYTWPANQFSASLSTALGSDDIAVTSMFTLESSSAPGRTNKPHTIHPAQTLAELYSEDSHDSYQNKRTPYRWFALGDTLYLWPISTDALYLWMHYIPVVHTLAADGDELLSIDAGASSYTTRANDLICMNAALKAKPQVEDSLNPLAQMYQVRQRAFLKTITATRQIMEPQRIARG